MSNIVVSYEKLPSNSDSECDDVIPMLNDRNEIRKTNRLLAKLRNLIKFQRIHRNKWSRIICISIICLVILLHLHGFGQAGDQLELHSLPPVVVVVPPLEETNLGTKVKDGYLVWSPSCQMPSLDPLATDVMKLFRRGGYESCSSTDPLTRIEINWTSTEAMLIYETKPSWFSLFHLKSSCCYSEIIRAGSGQTADEQFDLLQCVEFNKSFQLPSSAEFIYVKCTVLGFYKVYENTHAIIRERPKIRHHLNEFKEKSKQRRPLSVLMLSIDSISRLNLLRAMPKTAQQLYDSGWFELQGYNKIDDNTFPNIMAILTGYNYTMYDDECEPKKIGMLDKCPFVWKDFKKNGYVTSYGEDETTMSSFTVQKPGFLNPPTDYYLRPYMLAAEKYLPIKKKHSLSFCLGNKHSADHIYDYAMDFGTHYKNDASFGLYWTNTFSHDDISDPSTMDDKIRRYLDTLESRGILNESMVVFLSDHGMRFGPVRQLITGWLEERLPFIFIWLPEWFRNEHPEIVQALKINRNRLTNPYDLHMTLKHVLQLANPSKYFGPAKSCLNCQSLFTEIPWNRSCADASIAPHWCTCSIYRDFDKTDKTVSNAVRFVIDDINQMLMNFTQSNGDPLCAELKLSHIADARKAEYHDANNQFDNYLLKFKVLPSNAWFEATVQHHLTTNVLKVSGSVSRLNRYSKQSDCMNVDYLKKYCYCI